MKQFYLGGLLLLLSVLTSSNLNAQNVQLHYDFGHKTYEEMRSRPSLTTTVEMFRPDRFGSTFFFVDMNYKESGVQSAYWEIARDIRFWNLPVALHLEYNGGLSNTMSYNDAYLLGTSFSYNNRSYTFGASLIPMYKYLSHAQRPHSWQLTGTWYYNFLDDRFSFNGFADLWGDRNTLSKEAESMIVFLAEPQLWINLHNFAIIPDGFNLSLGTECKLYYNFPLKNDRLKAIPTLALKWQF